MSIGAIGFNALMSLNLQARDRDIDAEAFAGALSGSANSAGSPSILPGGFLPSISFESVLSLQSLDEPKPVEPPSATDIFLEEAQKHPMERLREQIMQELGISEEDLAQLPPEEKRAMEDKIRQMIEQKLREGMNAGDPPPSTNAEMLQQLT